MFMTHLRGLVLFVLFFVGFPRRSFRIDDSHHESQQRNNSLKKAHKRKAVAREAWLPSGSEKAVFPRRGRQAGALNATRRQEDQLRPPHGQPPSMRFRGLDARRPFGTRRAAVALRDAGPDAQSYDEYRANHSEQEVMGERTKTLPQPNEVKADFRLLAARTNRGFYASLEAREKLRTMAVALEQTAASSPQWAPTASRMLLGRWYLDFTDAIDVLSLALSPVPFEIGDVYQEIAAGRDEGCFTVQNAVELLPKGAGVLSALTGVDAPKGLYSIEAACQTLDATKVSLAFIGGRLQPLVSPLALPPLEGKLPEPAIQQIQNLFGDRVYLETTYLDEDLRIGRGPGNELYVLSKRETMPNVEDKADDVVFAS